MLGKKPKASTRFAYLLQHLKKLAARLVRKSPSFRMSPNLICQEQCRPI